MASGWARRIVGGVAVVVVVAALAVVAAVGLVPLLTGASTYTVLTGSMQPTLPVGAVVVVRPVPVERIAVGDVVTFLAHDPGTSATRIVTHRVIGIDPGPVLRTRGDANDAPDPGATVAADVRGVLWYSVPWVGRIPSTSWLLLAGGVSLLLAGGVSLLLVGASVLAPQGQRAHQRR
jgi:signal peptidase I